VSALDRLDVGPMTQDEAEAIAEWRYDPPYDFYDAVADHRDLAELLDPVQRGEKYFAARDENGKLVGYFGFVEADGTVGVGVGLRPDLTGRGFGLGFLEQGLAFADKLFAPQRFRLIVAKFNVRAITVYERAGFVATRTYEHETNGGVFSFVEMQRPA
jgi:ribosomal-protein-alanine N-acetyltransferase